MYPEIPLPPKPILTRWGTWLEAVEYYAEHIDSINNVLLALDSEDAVSIDTAKTVTCDISVKNDLAHIQHTFSCIIKTLKSLQNRHLSLSESFEIINSTVEQLNRGRGKVADAVRAKVDTVLSKNPGYEELQKVVAVMSGESTVKINLDLSPADIVKLNYVPVTSCDVERSFSQYKSILRDNRRRFTFQHLKEMFVTYCYGASSLTCQSERPYFLWRSACSWVSLRGVGLRGVLSSVEFQLLINEQGVDKFRATGCTERKKSVRQPTKVTEDAAEDARERMQQSPNNSVKKLAVEIGVSYGSAHKILRKKLGIPVHLLTLTIQKPIQIDGQKHRDLRFADDIILFANSADELSRGIQELAQQSKKAGLELKLQKTKLMTNSNEEIIEINNREL
ncbi:hypothetical protein ANN_24510 [Periplaneta americana]|uniref:Reverse transcriptase domain-containing protein n=1 Tax=Periplaneta americana TaxID=6978 RepID=A0ABQ8S386_PERAM|nr:hypothetical protein ANN_24510 [Periplaneta americana]